jgi:uncharacterized protein
MKLGTLRALYRYPVKSLQPEILDAVYVDANGLEGDRRRALIAASGTRAGKPARGKEHPRFHLLSTADEAAANAPEEQLALHESEDRYYDDAPVSLIVDRWLDGVSAYAGYPVEHQRFRPNVFIEAGSDVPLEDALTGRELHLGEVVLRVRYPIERCVVPTYDLRGGESDPRILRYVTRERSAWMGIYCDVPRAGIVRIGDSLSLIER